MNGQTERRTMQHPEGASEERWEQARDWAYGVMAAFDNGHRFRIPSDDVSVMVCEHCDLHTPNDASFDFGLCPEFYTDDGELKPRRNATEQPLAGGAA